MRKILFVHDYYRRRGGEDEIFEVESALFENRGHEVVRFSVSNDQIGERPSLGMALGTVWNGRTFRELRDLVRRERPEIVQFHNTLPLISPAAYWAVRAMGAAVVQIVQNYRLTCPSAFLMRENNVCEQCLGRRVPWPAVRFGCYRGSRAASAAVASMLVAHRILGTWKNKVDTYIVPNEFMVRKLAEGGIARAQLAVRRNLIDPDPGEGKGGGGYALFVGRLSEEKGISVLLRAWQRLGSKIPLLVAGSGPLENALRSPDLPDGIQYLGQKDRPGVLNLMRNAEMLIVPSIWYEASPMTIGEAFAVGLPVVASDLGGMAALVEHRVTGSLFQPGDVDDLVKSVNFLMSRPERLKEMRRAARNEFETKYSADCCYRASIDIYESALARRTASG